MGGVGFKGAVDAAIAWITMLFFMGMLAVAGIGVASIGYHYFWPGSIMPPNWTRFNQLTLATYRTASSFGVSLSPRDKERQGVLALQLFDYQLDRIAVESCFTLGCTPQQLSERKARVDAWQLREAP